MARNRLLMLAGAIAAAIVVVAGVVLVVGTSSPGTAPATTTTGATGGNGNEAVSAFKGVPQHGDTLGKATAPVTLTVFEDPQCPFCRDWNIDTLPSVVRGYVRNGRIKIVYRGIAIVGPNSVAGLRANYAAGLQNKLWNLAGALYDRQGSENSGWITLSVIRQAAREAGALPAKVIADADSKAVTAKLEQAANEAKALGINGTPTFGITKPLGTIEQLEVAGLQPSQFLPALDQALQ